MKILKAGPQAADSLTQGISSLALDNVFEGALEDMDLVTRELTG